MLGLSLWLGCSPSNVSSGQPSNRTVSSLAPVSLRCGESLPHDRATRRPLILEFEELDLSCLSEDRWAIAVDGGWFNVARKGTSSAAFASCEGRVGRGLEVVVPPSDFSPTGMDKVIIDLLGRYERPRSMLEFGQTHEIRFAFRLALDSELPAPGGRFLLFQLWQGAPFGPPLRVELEPDGTLAVYVLNDVTGSGPCASNPSCAASDSRLTGPISLVRQRPVQLGRWHEVILVVTPRHVAMEHPGRVEVVIDGDRTVDDVFVGFEPTGHAGYVGTQRTPNPVLEVGLGIYRTQQPRLHRVCFDDLFIMSSSAAPTARK